MGNSSIWPLALALAVGAAQAAPVPSGGMPVSGASYMGVGVIDLSEEAARDIGLIDPHGIEISSVAEGSPADRAGLLAGDIALTFRGERVNGYQHFARLVRETPAGRTVELGILRGGKRMAVQVTTGRRLRGRTARSDLEFAHEAVEAARRLGAARAGLGPSLPALRVMFVERRLGVETDDVEGQLARFFGVERGVLVRHVQEGAPAAEAEMRAGDVIVAVNGSTVATSLDLRRMLSRSRSPRAEFAVVRRGERILIEVEGLPSPAARPGSAGR